MINPHFFINQYVFRDSTVTYNTAIQSTSQQVSDFASHHQAANKNCHAFRERNYTFYQFCILISIVFVNIFLLFLHNAEISCLLTDKA